MDDSLQEGEARYKQWLLNHTGGKSDITAEAPPTIRCNAPLTSTGAPPTGRGNSVHTTMVAPPNGRGSAPPTPISLTNVPVQYPDSVGSQEDIIRSSQHNGGSPPQGGEYHNTGGPHGAIYHNSGVPPHLEKQGIAKIHRFPCENESLPQGPSFPEQPPVVDILKRKVGALELRTEHLQRQIDSLQRENISLRRALAASDNEKDQKIGELHTLYTQTSDRLQKQTMFTKSLADKVMQMTLDARGEHQSLLSHEAGASSSSTSHLNEKQLIGKITSLNQENVTLKKKKVPTATLR